MSPGLRKKIETIGKEILDKYCQDFSSRPIMIPPVPNSKFLEKFPEGELDGKAAAYKELQDAYIAEVKVYRCFEELERDVLVIHQIEYTHEQYSAFVPQHDCNKKRCKAELHPCHQSDKNIDGETDFVVIGPDVVAVFEVKGLAVSKYQTCCSQLISQCSVRRNGMKFSVQEKNAVEFEGCCEKAARQRNRMVNLVKHLQSSVHVYQFTILPNISKVEVDEGYLSDKTLVFSEELENLTSWFDMNIPSSVTDLDSINSAMSSIKCSLLGLWCFNKDNKWDTADCSLSRCIKDIDAKAKRALVTQQAVNQYQHKHSLKDKKHKERQYPNNPGIVHAPKVFKEYLNINCLTQDQLDVFYSEERFLWVDGPAGSGKTIVMLGKIIDIVANKDTEGRVLVFRHGIETTPAVLQCHKVLNNISEDITCTIIEYRYSEGDGDINDKVAAAERSLIDQLSTCRSRIVVLAIVNTFTSNNMCDVINSRFNYVFVDDYEALFDCLLFNIYKEPTIMHTCNIIADGLVPVIQNCSTNNTCLWIFCDMGQCLVACILRDRFTNMFTCKKLLSVNMRNTYELSVVLSVIREHYNTIELLRAGTLGLPQQNKGHFLRGTKPTIYLLRDDNPVSCLSILEDELCKLRGPGSSLDGKDIAVLCNANQENFIYFIHRVCSLLMRWTNNMTLELLGNCSSAEWPAIIYLHQYKLSTVNLTRWRNFGGPTNDSLLGSINDTQSNNREDDSELSCTFPVIYNALSRARVYSTAIIYNYIPNTCPNTDKMISELHGRKDLCKIIWR